MGEFDFEGGECFKDMMPLQDTFSKSRLLVAGEVGIDEYLWGDSYRISPEAPVPVVEVESRSYHVGLAGNVARNIISLGGQARLVSICGEDEDSERLKALLNESGLSEVDFIVDSTRPTLRKTRVMARNQHVVRVDHERSHPLDARLATQFTRKIIENLESCDGVIVQDYGKGLWNTDTMGFVAEARRRKKPVFVDPSRQSLLSIYQDATLLTPNLVEAEILCGLIHESQRIAGKNDRRLEQMLKHLLQETRAEHAVITCGEWGMVSISRDDNRFIRIPTFAKDVFDVTGAGDTVIAVFSMLLSQSFAMSECMQIANASAGIVVGKMGAATVSIEELNQEMKRLNELGFF